MPGPDQIGGAKAQWQQFTTEATKFGGHVQAALSETPSIFRDKVLNLSTKEQVFIGTTCTIGVLCPPIGLGAAAGGLAGVFVGSGIGVLIKSVKNYRHEKAQESTPAQEKQQPGTAPQSRQSVASGGVNTQDTASTPAQLKPQQPRGPSPRASTPPALGGVASSTPATSTPITPSKTPLSPELKNKIEQFKNNKITLNDLDQFVRTTCGNKTDKEMVAFKRMINDNMGEIKQILGDKAIEFIRHSLLQDAEGTQLTAPWRGEEVGQIFYAAYCNLMYDTILNKCIGTETDMSQIELTDFLEKIAEEIKTHPQNQELQELHQAHENAALKVQEKQKKEGTTEGKVENPKQFVVGAFALRVLSPRCTNACVKNFQRQQASLAEGYKKMANTLQPQANAYGAGKDTTIKSREPVQTAAFDQLRDALFGQSSARPPAA